MFGLNPWVILAVVGAFIAQGFYWDHNGHARGVEQTAAAYEKKLQEQRDEANALLVASQNALIAKERELYAFTMEVGRKHAEDQKRIDGLRLANGRLVDATCGMFDRSGRPRGQGGSDGVPGDPGAALSAQGIPAICKLPGEIREIVRQFGLELGQILFEAYGAAIYARAGHEYAVGPPRQ